MGVDDLDLQTNDYYVCTCKKVTPKVVCMLLFSEKVSELKIENGGEGLFQNLNDLFKTSVNEFFTLYSTLLYSTSTNIHYYYFFVTPNFASCKKLTPNFAGVMV